MASFVYGRGALRLIIGNGQTTTIDWTGNTDIKCALSTSTHVPNKDDTFYDDGGTDDLIDGELSGSGYTAGGVAMSGKTLAYDASNDRVEFDANDVQWSAINAGTAAQATILRHTGTATTSPVLCNIDSGFPVTTNGGSLTIQWHAEGIFHLTV